MTKLPTLTTARLTLRPFVLGDATTVQQLAGAWAVADTTLNIPHPYPDGMAEEWISHHRERFQHGESLTLAITLRAGSILMGAISLRPELRFDRAEMGYWIGQPYWGQGHCTEAARALIAYGFGEMGLNRIYATHLVRNPASGRVMQKAGMTFEGTLRQHVKKGDRYEDLHLYGILRHEAMIGDR